MPLLNPNSIDEKEIKRGEQKLKSIMGGKILHDVEFIRLLKINSISNTSKVWSNINNQIKEELKSGALTYEDVESRVYQLILMESPNDRLITLAEVDAIEIENKKRNILSKGSLYIQLPYKSSGVGDVVIGSAVLGRSGAVLGALNEGEVKWNETKLLFMDNGINVKSTGDVVLYEDVKNVILGEKGFLHTIITVVTHNGGGLIFKVSNNDASAVKSIIDDEITTIENNVPVEGVIDDNIDILMKYADLFERGLITKEEFNRKKDELLYSKVKDDSSLNQQQNRTLYCGNCGQKVDSDSNFCTFCGHKI